MRFGPLHVTRDFRVIPCKGMVDEPLVGGLTYALREGYAGFAPEQTEFRRRCTLPPMLHFSHGLELNDSWAIGGATVGRRTPFRLRVATTSC